MDSHKPQTAPLPDQHELVQQPCTCMAVPLTQTGSSSNSRKTIKQHTRTTVPLTQTGSSSNSRKTIKQRTHTTVPLTQTGSSSNSRQKP